MRYVYAMFEAPNRVHGRKWYASTARNEITTKAGLAFTKFGARRNARVLWRIVWRNCQKYGVTAWMVEHQKREPIT